MCSCIFIHILCREGHGPLNKVCVQNIIHKYILCRQDQGPFCISKYKYTYFVERAWPFLQSIFVYIYIYIYTCIHIQVSENGHLRTRLLFKLMDIFKCTNIHTFCDLTCYCGGWGAQLKKHTLAWPLPFLSQCSGFIH